MTTDIIVNPPRRRKLGRWKALLLGIGVFVLTIAILYLQENIRGKLAWKNFKQRYEAKGKSLDWSKVIPPPLPDEQNIYKAPGMGSWEKGGGTGRPSPIRVAFSEVYQLAPQFRDMLVARISLIQEAEATSGVLAGSVREVAAAINSRGDMLHGATGLWICRGRLSTEQPLTLAVRGQMNFVLTQIKDQLPELEVRSTNQNRVEIYLKNASSAEYYTKAYEMQKLYFEQLAAALKRPNARLEGDYSNPLNAPVQNFVAVRVVAQTLAQVAQSYILLDKPKEALESLTVLHDMERMITAPATRQSVTLVAAMINSAIKGLYIAVVADGQRLGVWRESELKALQLQMSGADLLTSLRDSLNTEVLSLTTACQIMPIADLFTMGGFIILNDKTREPDVMSLLGKHLGSRLLNKLIPKGWILQNAIRYTELMEEHIAAASANAPGISPSAISNQAVKLESELAHFSPYIYLARAAIPNFVKAPARAAQNQTLLQLGSISMALERYHLAEGKYPFSLESLCPAYMASIPRDVITGKDPIYRVMENGKYLLYSVGWNEKDDGGVEGKSYTEGDWVWNPEKKQ